MKTSVLVLAGLVAPALAGAEPMGGTNYTVAEQQQWETGEGTGYWMMNSHGVVIFDDESMQATAIECHGAGYWDAGGSWGEGICKQGDDAGAITTSWRIEPGAEEGRWEILSSTGAFSGTTGSGTYVSTSLPGGRSVSRWVGEGTMSE